jgi:hypothetical protein
MIRLTREIGTGPQGMIATSYLSGVWAFLGALLLELRVAIRAFICRFVESLHETRRQQAGEIIRRNRHLIHEASGDTRKDTCEIKKKPKR